MKGTGLFVFFFFQAEDGIRDAQESRGLGDVYKRQVSAFHNVAAHKLATGELVDCDVLVFGDDRQARDAVSYTHLTLPTIYSV